MRPALRRRVAASFGRLLLAACLGSTAVGAAAADNLRVLSAGAVRAVAVELAPGLEARLGRRLDIATDTAGGLVRRGLAGEAFDVLIATRAGIEELERAGKTLPGSAVVIGRVGIGAAVREGVPAPAIDTPEHFRETLLAARAVAFIDPAAGGSSGIYIARLFERMGIAPQMEAKAVRVSGGLVADRLLDGRADLALQQMSELLAVPGIRVLGPIPGELQNDTVYAGAVSAASADPEAARAVLAAFKTPEAERAMQAHGMAAP